MNCLLFNLIFLELSPENTEIVDKGGGTAVYHKYRKKTKVYRILEKSIQGWRQDLRSPTFTK